jgi:hypothetical protein
MKTMFVTAVALVSSLNLLAQGYVSFSNFGGHTVSNYCTDQPVELGTTFRAALYYAADGVTDEALFIQLGTAVPFGPIPGVLWAVPEPHP